MSPYELYFRAWEKKEQYMSAVLEIEFVAGFVTIFDKNDNQVMKEFIEIDLMQGIEINGKVVYEGDIIRVSSLWGVFEFPINEIFEIKELLKRDGWEVIGNIYEEEEDE